MRFGAADNTVMNTNERLNQGGRPLPGNRG